MTQYTNDPSSLQIHGKSFYWASFFLPKKNRSVASELYSICRYFDDLADENEGDQTEQLTEELKKIQIDKENPIRLFFHEHKITLSILEDLIESLIKEQQKVRIKNEKELIQYAYQVAGTVGLMMSPLIMVKDKKANKHAVDLGIAMQLTNIARDVIEDQKINRYYIKCDFENITSTLRLADMFYDSSFSSLKKIPFQHRFAIIVARRVYRQIGRKITNKKNIENYKKSGKIYVNNFGKIIQTFLSLGDLIKLFFVKIESHQRSKEHDIINAEINLNERI